MKTSKNHLLSIGALGLAGVIDQMDDDRYDEYCGFLSKFVEDFPGLEERVRSSFISKDQDALSTALLKILSHLRDIRADELVKNNGHLPATVNVREYDKTEAELISFLTAVSSLSIAVQMAQHRDDSKPDAGRGNQSTGAKKIILAVDDMPFLLDVLGNVLQGAGYKFVGVTSGGDALKYLERNTPDMFILDIEMPGMDGYELAGEIRARGHKAPIVFLTGNATKDHALKAIMVGAADFIIKPINKDQVLEKIDEYME